MIKKLLMSSSYWTLNKDVVKTLGIETAFFLTNLVEADSLLADEEGWFYQTIETIENLTTLSRRKQDASIKELISRGILIQQNRGIPMKRYFKLNTFKINELISLENRQFVQNVQTSMSETDKLKCSKRTTNKELSYKELNKKINIPFEEFWNLYDKKKETSWCLEKWNKLTDKDRELIIKHIPIYKSETKDKQFLKYPKTYLNSKIWLDIEENYKISDKKEMSNTDILRNAGILI